MPSVVQLTPLEARIIGCLIEKQITTPDQYPLSLNALVNACNQKSNRDPVLSLTEADVQAGLNGLVAKRLVTEQTGFSSRVAKFQHRFCNTEFGSLKFTPQELAIVCELLLRGAQMPGELRARADRLATFRDVGELEEVLTGLAMRSDGPFAARLEREPGRRESRYMHLFSGAVPVETPAETTSVARSGPASPPKLTPREEFTRLGEEVDSLRAEVAHLLADVEKVRRALG